MEDTVEYQLAHHYRTDVGNYTFVVNSYTRIKGAKTFDELLEEIILSKIIAHTIAERNDDR